MVTGETETASLGSVSKRLGLKWKLMSKEDKLPYMLEAERLKQMHRIQHPDYKFVRSTAQTTTGRATARKRCKRSNESCGIASSASSSYADDVYSLPQPSPYSVKSTTSDKQNSVESGSNVDVDDLDISNFEFDSTGFENLMSVFDFGPIGSVVHRDRPNDVNTHCDLPTTPLSSLSSTSAPQPVAEIDFINQSNSNQNTSIKHTVLESTSLAITPPTDDDTVIIKFYKNQILFNLSNFRDDYFNYLSEYKKKST